MNDIFAAKNKLLYWINPIERLKQQFLWYQHLPQKYPLLLARLIYQLDWRLRLQWLYA